MNIDINSDLGEAFGPYVIADDEALMGVITSANVACGYHAGDPVVMDRTIRLARAPGARQWRSPCPWRRRWSFAL